MNYPRDFIEKIKKEYPDLGMLDVALKEENDRLVGMILGAGAHLSMSPREIVRALNDGRVQEVIDDATNACRRVDLRNEWVRLFDEQL